jgi:DNA adenine methylase
LNEQTLPFLRWAGGKRWLTPYLAPAIQKTLEQRYIEPFLGSAAMFFAIQPESAILGDLNEELINVYRQVRRTPQRIEEHLAGLSVDATTYYKIRAEEPQRVMDRAIRFIYLNRLCFGGLHRTNRRGQFNVPYGGGSRTPEPVYRDHLLGLAARLLRRRGISLVASDFASVVDCAQEGDVVFCDPTYRSAGRGRFDRYGPLIFSWRDQIRLANAVKSARRRGAVSIVMNVDDRDIMALYPDAIFVHLARRKAIGNTQKMADSHRELIAILDPLRRTQLWSEMCSSMLRRFSPTEPDAIRGAA